MVIHSPRSSGYGGAARGCQHQALLTKVQDLRRQSEDRQVSLEQLMDFLAYDLVAQHIVGEDAKFFPLLAGH